LLATLRRQAVVPKPHQSCHADGRILEIAIGSEGGPKTMKIGAVMFFTTESMQPAALGARWRNAASKSLWCRNTRTFRPPASRPIPASGGLVQAYYGTHGSFPGAQYRGGRDHEAQDRHRHRPGDQRDPIVTAKMVFLHRPALQRPIPVRRGQ